MAKAADKKQQKTQQQQADDLESALAAAMASEVEAPVEDLASQPEPALPRREYQVSTFDIAAVASAGANLHDKVVAVSTSLEALRRGWEQLDTQLVASRDEVVRLQAVEQDRSRLNSELDGHRTSISRLEKDLAASRADALAASERASKFEEICESIKERAFELHTALQEVKSNEEKYIADLDSAKAQLADAGRRTQDEGVARLAAEERGRQLEESVKRLEADEAVARDRIAKLVEDNKTITSQVPALLVDRERLQKQFSASERENARLASERQSLSDRVRGLEDEIRTLRADLGSLTPNGVRSEPKIDAEASAPADDDFDLEASLERVFSAEMSNPDKGVKH